MEELVNSSENMANYGQILASATASLKDMFDMMDRSLVMSKSLHDMQLQGIDKWVDVCKFLLPIFATFATAGLAISTPGFNGTVAVIVGGAGFISFLTLLFAQMAKRKSVLAQQEVDLVKLNQVFTQYRELNDLHMQSAAAERGELTDKKLGEQMERILNVMKEDRR
ncbi:hypothetical protein I8H84_05205 [Candidatus Saccharibacteria bacterium]|nr:hypothetical protein [Candidatus Saccharibacteria bacterium]MBH1990493.1 hypothetical protein [Candidatus Saccharibacteria bacterium]